MAANRDDLWHQGFKAGGCFGGRCPYPQGSQAARAWQAGWAEGVMRRTGATYRSRPEPTSAQVLLKKLRRLLAWAS